MSEMVDRVARRLYEAADNPEGDNPAWEDVGEDYRDAYRHDARACIAAMREPTPAMVVAGDATNGSRYAAMIDAALA